MAKISLSVRQKKRETIVIKYRELRKKLKEEKNYEALSRLPRNASPVRLRNRCKLTGRPRGYIRKFGLCRNKFRELAQEGKIPGLRPASW